jgi:ribonuclease HI
MRMEEHILLIEKCRNFYGNITIAELLTTLKCVRYLDVYTDGATQFIDRAVKARVSGIGVYFEYPLPKCGSVGIAKLVETSDNNECEILACIEALRFISKDDDHELQNIKFVHILTDSRLVFDRMTGVCRSSKCKDLFDELIREVDNFIDVKFSYVKGHSDIKGNIEADRLSRSLF